MILMTDWLLVKTGASFFIFTTFDKGFLPLA